MKCRVESTAELPAGYRFTFDEKEVTLTPSLNEEGRSVVTEIAIKKRIPESTRFKTSVTPPGSDGTVAEIRIDGTEELVKELKEDLQFLESVLSLSMVTKIKWSPWDSPSPKLSFIPESPEEKESLAVYSTQEAMRYPKVYMALKREMLDQEVGRLRELTVPLAFFREGVRSYEQFNYIASFQNFYFIVEGFYAEGEFKGQDERFTRNPELVDYTRSAFGQIMRIEEKLEPFFKFYKLDKTPESFLKLAVKVRHRVHHYFHGGQVTEYFGNPMTQDYYEPMALSLMLLCAHILFGKVKMLHP